jgi:hypothetical protein
MIKIMKLRRVQVECYAGGRADERPRRVRVDEREHVISRLLGSSVEGSLESKEFIYRYRVLTVEGLVLDLVRTSPAEWYLQSVRQAI